MSDQFVLYETDDKVGIITLDHADKLNAISSAPRGQRPAEPLPGGVASGPCGFVAAGCDLTWRKFQ